MIAGEILVFRPLLPQEALEVDLARSRATKWLRTGGSGRVLTVYFCTNRVGTLTRTTKETLVPVRDYRYPHMQER